MAIQRQNSKRNIEDVSPDATSARDLGGPTMFPTPAPKGLPAGERRHTSFFEVINASLSINSPEQFCAWSQNELQRKFPHGMLACGIGEIEHLDSRPQKIISCNFPVQYIKTLQQNGGLTSSPVIAQWLNTRRPVLFEISRQTARSVWLESFKRFDLQNMAAHGQCDIQSKTTSYFAFARIPGRLTPRHSDLLEMLVPHLHVALIRALNNSANETAASRAALPGLSLRESEILHWLGEGKTNWEIAQVLHISENTVKNHVQRILAKLKVNNRAQAVAKGLGQ